MRKVILLIVVLLSYCGFSQEAANNEKDSIVTISRFDAQMRWNQIGVRLDQTILGSKYPYEFRFRARFSRAELFIGKTYPLTIDRTMFFTISSGLEYRYSENQWNVLARAAFRGRYSWGLLRINYGSNWVDNHGISSSLLFNITTTDFRLGIATNNEFVGPRTEVRFKLGKKDKKKIVRFHVAWFPEEDRFDYGVRLRFGEWFPKVDQKIKKIGDNLNPFTSTNK